MTDVGRIAQVARCLAVEARVKIVELLQGKALCVGGLAARLGLTQGAVSQHLRVLRDAGLVAPERRGCFVHYRLNEAGMRQCRDLLSSFLAQAAPDFPCLRGGPALGPPAAGEGPGGPGPKPPETAPGGDQSE